MAALPDVVVLAAGRSSRMGEPKGLVRVAGRPWLEVQLEALARAGLARVVVVLGFDRDAYARALPDLARRVTVELNPDPDRGPFSSLQHGLGAVAGGAFVLPVDVPAASPPVWSALAHGLSGGGASRGRGPEATPRPAYEAAVPTLEGRGGHPVLLAPPLVRRLLAAPATSRLDHELAASRVIHVAVSDPRIRLNLNRPEDWGTVDRGA